MCGAAAMGGGGGQKRHEAIHTAAAKSSSYFLCSVFAVLLLPLQHRYRTANRVSYRKIRREKKKKREEEEKNLLLSRNRSLFDFAKQKQPTFIVNYLGANRKGWEEVSGDQKSSPLTPFTAYPFSLNFYFLRPNLPPSPAPVAAEFVYFYGGGGVVLFFCLFPWEIYRWLS